MNTLTYEDLREARRQILAVEDSKAQAALFTVLDLLHQLAEEIGRSKRP